MKRVSSYFESLEPDGNIFSIWIQESAERPHMVDFLEPVLNRQIWLSTITRSASSNSSESRHVARQSILPSRRLSRMPAQRPEGDCRFTTRKQDRIYMCDRCNREVRFQNKTTPFLGAYLSKTWTCEVSEEEALWESGEIDATFYCLPCLAWYHEEDENETRRMFLCDETAYRQKRTWKWWRTFQG